MHATIHHPRPGDVSRDIVESNLSQQLGEPITVDIVLCARCPRAILVLDGEGGNEPAS